MAVNEEPERADSKQHIIYQVKIMVDADIAQLYGGDTKCLNEQVKRNNSRFPENFMFELTKEEKEEKNEVAAIYEHFENLQKVVVNFHLIS